MEDFMKLLNVPDIRSPGKVRFETENYPYLRFVGWWSKYLSFTTELFDKVLFSKFIKKAIVYIQSEIVEMNIKAEYIYNIICIEHYRLRVGRKLNHIIGVS